MKRIVTTSLLILALMAGSIGWRGWVGFVVKTWAYFAFGAELCYKSLDRENGAFVFREFVLSEEKISWFRAEKLSIQINPWWPFQGKIEGERPQLVLSQQKVRGLLASKGSSPSSWVFQFHNGNLQWIDGVLPDAEWSFFRREKKHIGEVSLSWGKQSVFLDMSREKDQLKWEGAVSQFPLAYLSELLKLVDIDGFSDCRGNLNGAFHCVWNNQKIENLSLQAEGENLAARIHSFAAKGTVSINTEIVTGNLTRFRLSVEEGGVAAGESALKDVSVLATFHEAGTKWECKATAWLRENISFPFEMQGREARFHPTDLASLTSSLDSKQSHWVEGAWRLGGASGYVSKDSEWIFGWNQVGVLEGAFVQELSSAFYPQLASWKIDSGVVSGALKGTSWKELSIFSLAAENIAFGEIAGCRRLECLNGIWSVEGGWYLPFGVEHLEGRWDTNGSSVEASGQGFGPWELSGFLEYRKGRFFAEALEGKIGDLSLHANGWLEPSDEWAFSLQVPSFSGEIPTWAGTWGSPFLQGQVEALGTGFSLKGLLKHPPRSFDVSLAFHFSDVTTSPFLGGPWLEEFSGDGYLSSEKIDFVGLRGIGRFALGDQTIAQELKAPKISFSREGNCFFDLRLEGHLENTARFVGTKQGNQLNFDLHRSHLMGQPFSVGDTLFDEHGLASTWIDISLEKQGIRAQVSFLRDGVSKGFFSMDQWKYQGIEGPLHFQMEYQNGRIKVFESSLGPLKTSFQAVLDAKGLKLEEGKLLFAKQAAWDFTGNVTAFQKAELNLSQGWVDLSQFHPELKGFFNGKGCVSFSSKGIEADFDGWLKQFLCREVSFENKGPLHFFFSPLSGLVIQGVEGHFRRKEMEGHGKADLIHFDLGSRHWRAEKVHLHALEADIQGNVESDFNFESGSGFLQEAFLPYQGSMQHVRDVHFFFDPKQSLIEGMFCYKDKWAKALLQMDFDPPRGRLTLQETEDTSLSIDWAHIEEKGIFVQSIEGFFGGLEASFHAFDPKNPSQLIGSARFDASRVAGWIPEDIAKAFRKLEMGKGFELKGHLCLNPQSFQQTSFRGIFSGKQVELFGYQFRTLLAQTEIKASSVWIYDFQLSDSAGMLKVDNIRFQTDGKNPWTIDIPTLMVRELRPSLLHATGEEPDSLTPLVVRELKLQNLHGLLDELSTYTATGQVSFINSFKREKTLFDLPSDVLGRIVGLDLELLIPVKGEFLFTLKQGVFQLHDLKNAFSEGNRSEFFLVTQGGSPQMDLDGNLNIQIQMKQFVLFKFTEAFTISLQGTLKHPQFRLQKKNRVP